MKASLLSRLVLAALLLGGALPRAAAQTASLFDARAAALERRFQSAGSAPEQAALLGQLCELRELVADRAALAAFFSRAAADTARAEPVREMARQYATGRAAVVAPGLLAEARSAAAPGEAAALETLARLEYAAPSGTPLEHMLAAAKHRATAERWLLVARWSDAQPQIFAALSAALAAAPESSDVRLAFADYYAGRGQTHKALDLLADAARKQPGDYRVHWRAAELLATLGREAEADAEFARVGHDFPRPLWVVHHSAAHAAEAGRLDQAEALLASLLQEDPADAEARAQMARVLEKRRDVVALRALHEGSVALHLDDTEARRQLAAMNGETQAEANEVQVAKADDDEPYLADAPQLARAAQSNAAQRPSPESAVTLAEVRVERVAASGLATRRVQEVTLIASDGAARDYALREVQYAPATEDLRILRARIFKRDGRHLDAVEAGERNVADATVAMYYDARVRVVRFRNLQTGDVVELDYRATPLARKNPYGAGVYLGALVPFQSSQPQRLQRYVLIAPADRELRVAAERMPPPRVTVAGGERRYQWEARDVAALEREPHSPVLTEVAPYVHVSSFGSWQRLGRWYAALVRPQLALNDEMRAALAQALHGVKAGDELEKIRAIHELVLKQTHYVALEFGIYGYQPYPVAQTFARRFGDCKDKASLMIALLREAGIDAEFALVRTRRLGRVSEQASSISVFDHAIVYVPRHDLWLDGTAEYSGSRELPLEDQGAMALTVSLAADTLGAAALRQVPATGAEDNYSRRTVSAEVHADGTLQFSGTAYTRGQDAPGLRREYEIAERQRDSFRARLAEVLPAVQVETVDVVGAHNLENDITVTFRGTLDSFSGRKTLALTSTWMPRAYLQTLAPLARRTQPLLLAAPWTTEEDLRLTLPRDARVALLPPAQSVNTGFGSAQLSYEVRGRELRVHTRVQFRETRIAPEDYAGFRQFCSELERAFREEVKVVLP